MDADADEREEDEDEEEDGPAAFVSSSDRCDGAFAVVDC
jgi:hypothetical protein